MKISGKTIVKKVIKDNSTKLLSNILTKKIHKLYNDLPFLSKRMKIEKLEKLVANLREYIFYKLH